VKPKRGQVNYLTKVLSRTRIQSKAILFLIVLVSPLLCFQQVYAIPVSNVLEVPYHVQETNYYCGPACVQMGIEYVSGDVIPQGTLATEMKTDPVKGVTYSNMMHVPFVNRRYASVRGRKYVATDELKTQNSLGFVSILLIWFDTDHKYGHYVVVVGYDATGIFVNDPWPTYWGQPRSRKTGEKAFISDSLLADLWAYSDQWVLEIAYGPTVYVIAVSVIGLPENYLSRIKVDGTESGFIKKGELRSLSFRIGTSHTISVDQYVSGSEGTRYFCRVNSWTVSSADTHSFSYSDQYYLDVSSPYGMVSGSSWYDAGSMATFSVAPTEVSIPGFMGLLGAKIVFDGWSGDSKATTGIATIGMHSPKKVNAVWRTDYSQAYAILGAIIAAVVALAAALLMKRRKAISASLPPPPPSPPTAAA